eukprot:3899273-Prorocentrum_lima.AAC.1
MDHCSWSTTALPNKPSEQMWGEWVGNMETYFIDYFDLVGTKEARTPPLYLGSGLQRGVQPHCQTYSFAA